MPNELGKFIKQERKQKGFTLKALAGEIGYSDAYISMVENGKKKSPSYDFFIKIAEVLEVPYEELMIKAGYGTKENPVPVKSFLDLIPNSPSLNGFRQEDKHGAIAYGRYNFPINDLYFHLTDDLNKKMFKTVILSDYDRELIAKMIETYLLHKIENKKGDYSKSIDALTKKDFQFPNMNKEGD
ncbi:helix-turn-helix transcriptional regulator [Lentibacillus sp. L22]|uniref:helix-turn-helix domain-containing protein n=1 Tax=Lentibacillus sp. L22 TaxID=3163028 RepID=UPI0034650D5D